MNRNVTLGPDNKVVLRRNLPPEQDINNYPHVGDDQLVLMNLTELRLNKLLSKPESGHEGVLTAVIDDQETSLSWATAKGATDVKNRDKFKGQVLYFGTHDRALDINLELIELDENMVEKLKKADAALGLGAIVAGFVPGVGTAISAGLTGIRALFKLIRGKVDDDAELIFPGSLGDRKKKGDEPDNENDPLPLRVGGYQVLRRDPEEAAAEADVTVSFQVLAFDPILGKNERNVTLTLEVEIEPKEGFLSGNPDDRNIVFEAAFGSGTQKSNTSLNVKYQNGRANIQDIVGLRNVVVYRGPWTVGIPYDVSIAGVLDKKGGELLKEAITDFSGVDTTDVWVHELARPVKTRLTFEQANTVRWTPSGKGIVFSARGERNFDIFQRSADGTGEAELLVSSDGSDHPSSWTADGKYLVHQRSSLQTGTDIWYLERNAQGDGFDAHPFLETRFSETSPRVSPDGLFVAYISNESGPNDVYVRSFPDGAGKLRISPSGGVQARWAKTGTELFYVEGETLMAVSVSTENGFQAGSPRPLFRHAGFGTRPATNFDVSADGQRFLVVESLGEEAEGQQAIHVVQNWYEEFRDREQD